MIRFRNSLSTLILLLAAFFAGAPVAGQEPDEQPDPAAAQPEDAAQVDTSIELPSPRATVQTFLSAMNEVVAGATGAWPRALACIYTDGMSELEARELADQVYQVLNAFTLDIETIPTEVDSNAYTLVLSEEDDIELQILRNQDDHWRFARDQFQQDADELTQAAEEEAARVEDQLDDRIDPRVASPRATIATFLGAFAGQGPIDIEETVITLDLRHVDPNVREDKGEEYAFRMYEILTRVEPIVPQNYPVDPEETTRFVLLRDPNDPSRRIIVTRVPVETSDDEEAESAEEPPAFEWKFSRRSLDDLQAMWDETYRNMPQRWGRFARERPFGLILRDYMNENIPFLTERSFFIENWQWIGLIVVVFLGFVVSRVAGFVIGSTVRRGFRKSRFRLDEDLENKFIKPIRIALMAWVWWIALRFLNLDDNVLSVLKTAVITISVLAATLAAYRLVDILGNFLSARALRSSARYDDMVVPLIVRTLKVFVLIVGFVVIIEANEGNTTKFLAGLGIGGLAFALAAQDTVSNLFGSLTLLFDRPFQIGDWVAIGDVEGNVESVGMRSTRLRTFYNSMVTIPNSQLTTTVIDNIGARRYRRFKTNISVQYDTSPEKIDAFCEGIREFIRQHPYTRKDYYHVYLNSFSASALEILLYCFFECPDWSTELRERHRLMLDIVRLAKSLGVEFAFPTQTVHLFQEQHTPGSPLEGPSQTRGREVAQQVLDSGDGAHLKKPPPVEFGDPGGLAHGDENTDSK